MITRTILLNHLVRKYGLKCYLELGVQDRTVNFDLINCEHKVGVDIAFIPGIKYQMTTDEYFADHFETFDLIFIDASHYADQVEKDYLNSVQRLRPGGFIVLHDCNPIKEIHAIVPRGTVSGHWNGDVYKFACQLRDITTVDIDNGCGVIGFGHTEIVKECKPKDWADFDTNRKFYLNLVSWETFTNFAVPS